MWGSDLSNTVYYYTYRHFRLTVVKVFAIIANILPEAKVNPIFSQKQSWGTEFYSYFNTFWNEQNDD
jgi:hypothetical protein